MKEIDQIAAKLGVSSRTVYRRLEDVPRKKEPPAHKISVRVSGANWKLLKVASNRSETVNKALEEYFSEQ